MRARRILFDVTYTRLQHRPVGIARTVMRLAPELREAARSEGASFACVAFDGRAFREVPAPTLSARPGKLQPRLLTLVTGTLRSTIEQVLRLPWSLIRPLWAWASGFAFGGAVRSYPRVNITDGDLLLLCDAAWNYPVDRAVVRARRAGATVVSMIYDLMPLQVPAFCVPWVRSAFTDWLSRALRNSDAIICDSRFALDSTRDAAHERGWDLPPIGHFRLGCDVPVAHAGTVRPALLEFLRGGHVYASVGSFEPKKNYGLLVAAFEQLWQRGVDARLLVVGRRLGECEDVAARLARHARQSGRAMVVDDATDAEITHIYDHCRALLLPSLYEGFGLPLVEARTRGCPVIASDLPVFREIADEGVHWFDPHQPDDLVQLLARDAAGGVAFTRDRMVTFDWGASARQCLACIDSLLASRSAVAVAPRLHDLRGEP